MMHPHCLLLLLATTLMGTCSAQSDCSLISLVKNLTFPTSWVRPVRHWQSVTTVEIDMILYQIIKLDTSLQSLNTLIWFSMSWTNEFVSWEPGNHCGITSIFMADPGFWIPDLYVYEMTQNSDNKSVIPYYNVTYTGQITLAYPMEIVSSCEMNMFKFPFDTQKCNLSFGSYIYPDKEIVMKWRSNSSDVLNISIRESEYKGGWILKNITILDKPLKDGGHNYSRVSYEMTLKRVPMVYVLTLIIPASFMVILDIISMFIQVQSGERLGFKITIILGFSVLLLILNSILPTSDTAPALGIFCCLCMAVMMVSIMGCVLVSYMLMLAESQPNVPAWVRIWVLDYLPRLLCIRESSFKKRGIFIVDEQSPNKIQSLEANTDNKREPSQINLPKSFTDSINLEVKMLNKLLMSIRKIHEEMVNLKVKSEWHAAALVVDRLVLFVYLITVIALFIAVMIIWLVK